MAETFTVRRKFDYDILRPMGDTRATQHIVHIIDMEARRLVGNDNYRFVTTRPQFSPNAYCLKTGRGDIWIVPVVEDYGHLIKTVVAVAMTEKLDD